MSIPENPDPIALFGEWFDELKARAGVAEPAAATLVTVDAEDQPWPRVVLLKSFDAHGFVFYTNTVSTKGRQLAANPKAALNFYWPQTDKQVRVLGTAAPVSAQEADEYFASRPRGSRLGAWASEQSEPLESRELLEERLHEFARKYEGRDIPRPPHWSGYRIAPNLIEFWLKGPDRLHHRREYRRTAPGQWTQRLLNP
jgi:pyridoxamine 5'-phosphate oxidase